ncbi:WYL domain-containing protein [bacterium]|nr:WYL domain-containing protein [bacterium]
MSKKSSIERIFFIDKEIRENGFINIASVMQHFSCTKRTVDEDIHFMKDVLELPIKATRKKGITGEYIYKGFDSNKHQLALYLLKSLLSSDTIFPLKNIENRYSALSTAILYDTTSFLIPDEKIFIQIATAFVDKKQIVITHASPGSKPHKVVVEPLKLINYNAAWYLILWKVKENETRTYKLSRITSVTPQKKSFVNSIDMQALDNQLERSFGAFRVTNRNDEISVQIRFYGWAKDFVKDDTAFWNPEASCEDIDEKGNKYLELSIAVGEDFELIGKVLSFSPHAEIMAPEESREKWLNALQASVERYITPQP